jgi:hypothetical protein
MFHLSNPHKMPILDYRALFKLESLRILVWIRLGNHNDLKKTQCQNLKYSTEIGYNWGWEIAL